jgi:transaldolase / glucose-6-phosphate isomerase
MGLWIEQLVAESLGKDGTGAVPIVSEPLGPPTAYGEDRLFLSQLPIDELQAAGHPAVVGGSDASPHGIGHMAVTMELAVALTGAAIGVQPFDQPDVAAAKAATAEVLAEGRAEVAETPLADLLAQLQPGDHLAIQAFVDPGAPHAGRLEAGRVALRDRHRVATSLGFGPRYLHSTGQLHKGGPRAIVCVQVVSDDQHDVEIPGQPYGFGHLMAAQAAGDLRTLQSRGIRAARVPVADLKELGS